MRRIILSGIAAVVLCGLGYIVYGSFAVVASSVTVTVSVASWARMTAAGRPFVPPEPQIVKAPSGFPQFQQIMATLRWTPTNGRYFEVVTRPFLLSITNTLLADRRRLDVEHDARQVRELIGTDGWDLLYGDLRRDRGDAVPLARIAGLVDRLERL